MDYTGITQENFVQFLVQRLKICSCPYAVNILTELAVCD